MYKAVRSDKSAPRRSAFADMCGRAADRFGQDSHNNIEYLVRVEGTLD